jgi:ATP-binding cassette subfamily B protein
MLLIIIATWRMSRLLHQRFAKVQAAFSTMTEKVRETIAGIAVVKAYVNEKIRLAQFSDTSTDYIYRSLSLVRIWGLLFPMIIVFSNLSIALLVAAGGRLTILNSITPGDFVAFASYLWIIIWPMMALGWIVNLYQRGAASMVRINDILDIEPEQPAVQDPLETPRLTGHISIRNLTFAYGYGSPPVLNRMSMSIRSGDTIGITGMTASGKTTLCNLLLRLYEPPPATMFIDGIDICTLPRSLLRQSIAYVPQDSFLFSDSISDNIAFGRPDAGLPDIRHQATVAQLIDEVMEFRDGFETIIGERGITLSGGQKQRLCIARALMLPAPILLLDDALASLDLGTSRTITEALREQGERRTTIIVSNRIDSIRHADMIYVFADGGIAESGSHHELIQEGGLYHNLYRKQQLEQESR